MSRENKNRPIHPWPSSNYAHMTWPVSHLKLQDCLQTIILASCHLTVDFKYSNLKGWKCKMRAKFTNKYISRIFSFKIYFFRGIDITQLQCTSNSWKVKQWRGAVFISSCIMYGDDFIRLLLKGACQNGPQGLDLELCKTRTYSGNGNIMKYG